MNTLIIHAAWTLTGAFTLSFSYELYRATLKTEVSEHDSLRTFATQGILLYLTAGVVIALMFRLHEWAAWVGLIFSLLMILLSIFYYNPRIMSERQPDIIDWLEDLLFTGLLFVAATQITYALFWHAFNL